VRFDKQEEAADAQAFQSRSSERFTPLVFDIEDEEAVVAGIRRSPCTHGRPHLRRT